MILRMMPGQDDTAGGQLGPVAPHDLLQEGRSRLRLADMQDDPGARLDSVRAV
jgi:hypothetical protein